MLGISLGGKPGSHDSTGEQVAAVLQEASGPVRADLVQRFGALSNEYGNRAEFVASLPETIGLI